MNDISNYLSLDELCSELSISTATGKNWIKQGRLIPEYDEHGAPVFTPSYVRSVKSALASGENGLLRKRRNKRYKTGNALYSSYISKDSVNYLAVSRILDIIAELGISADSELISYLAVDCFLQLFADKYGLASSGNVCLLCEYLQHGSIYTSVSRYRGLIDDLIDDSEAAMEFCQSHPSLFESSYAYESGEDVLGLIYISCRELSGRKSMGAYYTPSNIVEHLIGAVGIHGGTILDPCCGTGNFLLQFPADTPFANVYGNDKDVLSVQLARLNMALRYDAADEADICAHITIGDFLQSSQTGYSPENGAEVPAHFNYIIGNPPWGYAFDKTDKALLKKNFRTAQGRSVESYDVFVECSLDHLYAGGELAFVLPEAILNVHAHRAVRQLIADSCYIKRLCYIGDIFDGVQCPAIILDMRLTGHPLETSGMVVECPDRQTMPEGFTIRTNRSVDSGCFCFQTTDEEYLLLEKLHHHADVRYLKGNADFAMGIVTGNNARYLSSEKTEKNEVILCGSDISKYHIGNGRNYIEFTPELFQQSAPKDMYRAPEKLLYRFVSDQLVFAYDNQRTLSLNSCNILIPRIDGLHIKYVLAVLNSRPSQFVYKKEFNSLKVLRSHIERIPIPYADAQTQKNVISLVDAAHTCCGMDYINRIDDIICSLFGLTPDERNMLI